MLVRDDLIHRADGAPWQAELLPAMPGFFQGNGSEEGLERRGDVGYVGLDRGWALVFLVQEVLGQAIRVHPFRQAAQSRRGEIEPRPRRVEPGAVSGNVLRRFGLLDRGGAAGAPL